MLPDLATMSVERVEIAEVDRESGGLAQRSRPRREVIPRRASANSVDLPPTCKKVDWVPTTACGLPPTKVVQRASSLSAEGDVHVCGDVHGSTSMQGEPIVQPQAPGPRFCRSWWFGSFADALKEWRAEVDVGLETLRGEASQRGPRFSNRDTMERLPQSLASSIEGALLDFVRARKALPAPAPRPPPMTCGTRGGKIRSGDSRSGESSSIREVDRELRRVAIHDVNHDVDLQEISLAEKAAQQGVSWIAELLSRLVVITCYGVPFFLQIVVMALVWPCTGNDVGIALYVTSIAWSTLLCLVFVSFNTRGFGWLWLGMLLLLLPIVITIAPGQLLPLDWTLPDWANIIVWAVCAVFGIAWNSWAVTGFARVRWRWLLRVVPILFLFGAVSILGINTIMQYLRFLSYFQQTLLFQSARFLVMCLGRLLIIAWPVQHAREGLIRTLAATMAPYQLISLATATSLDEVQ